MKFTRNELLAFLKEQRKVFDIVRLVNVSLTTQYEITDVGELTQGPYQCYTVWNKEKRCENRVSAKAFAIKGKLTKFEFVNNDVYFVTSIYTEVEGTPYMPEMADKKLYESKKKKNTVTIARHFGVICPCSVFRTV